MLWNNKQRTSNWIWITDFIPLTSDNGRLEGFKRYKKHRFNENKTRVVFFDGEKNIFFSTRGCLTSKDVEYKYSRYALQ